MNIITKVSLDKERQKKIAQKEERLRKGKNESAQEIKKSHRPSYRSDLPSPEIATPQKQ